MRTDRRRRTAIGWAMVAITAVLVGYLGVLVWSALTALPRAQANTRSAIAAEKALSARDERLMADLQAQIAMLQSTSHDNAGRISQLLAEVHALEAQVRALGAQPVIAETGPADNGTPPGAPPTTAAPQPAEPSTTTTTTARPPAPPTTVPAPPARRCVPVIQLCF